MKRVLGGNPVSIMTCCPGREYRFSVIPSVRGGNALSVIPSWPGGNLVSIMACWPGGNLVSIMACWPGGNPVLPPYAFHFPAPTTRYDG